MERRMVEEPDGHESVPTTSLVDSIKELERTRCYWGAISARDAGHLLADEPSGTFLVRDSGDSHHIFTISYRTASGTFHSRVPWFNGFFCLGGPSSIIRERTIVKFIKKTIESSNDPEKHILMHPSENMPMAETVFLTKPLDRINMLPSLKYLCRLRIRQHMRDYRNAATLPLPERMKQYLMSKKYLLVEFSPQR